MMIHGAKAMKTVATKRRQVPTIDRLLVDDRECNCIGYCIDGLDIFFLLASSYLLSDSSADSFSKFLQFRDRDYGVQISSTKKNDVNPVWDETFTFNIPTLDNMVLAFKLYDDDIIGKDDKCGKCKVNLERSGITSSPKFFEKTIDFNLIRRNGTLAFEISYEE